MNCLKYPSLQNFLKKLKGGEQRLRSGCPGHGWLDHGSLWPGRLGSSHPGSGQPARSPDPWRPESGRPRLDGQDLATQN